MNQFANDRKPGRLCGIQNDLTVSHDIWKIIKYITFDCEITQSAGSREIDILSRASACGIPHDFHGSFNNDHARPRWFARGRTQTRTADFLVTSNELTRASSHWLRFRFGSLSLALLSPDDSLFSVFSVPTGSLFYLQQRVRLLLAHPRPSPVPPICISFYEFIGSFYSSGSILVPPMQNSPRRGDFYLRSSSNVKVEILDSLFLSKYRFTFPLIIVSFFNIWNIEGYKNCTSQKIQIRFLCNKNLDKLIR